jgi:hypothetical protein
MLELKNLGLVEMSIQEQQEVEGGFLFGIICCAICLAYAIYELF